MKVTLAKAWAQPSARSSVPAAEWSALSSWLIHSAGCQSNACAPARFVVWGERLHSSSADNVPTLMLVVFYFQSP